MGLFWMIDGVIQKDRPIQVPQSRPPKLEREQMAVPERPHRSSQTDPGEQVRVSQVMSRNLVTLTEEHTVDDALTVADDFGFNHVPIVNADGQLVGIVSDRDLLRSSEFTHEALSGHMTRRVVVSRPSTFLKDAARLLMSEKVSSLPVVDSGHRLVGIVTMVDILAYLVRHPAMELWS